jgi:hypothetical protein
MLFCRTIDTQGCITHSVYPKRDSQGDTLFTKFQHRALLYNPVTKEDGAVRKAYEIEGVTMYEVAVPKDSDSWSAFYLSDWPEDGLQLSTNQQLKSSMLEMSDANLLT